MRLMYSLRDPGKIYSLSHRVLIRAFMCLAREQINPTPNDGKHRDAQMGRRVPKRLEQFGHNRTFRSRAGTELALYGRKLLLGSCKSRPLTPSATL